MKKIPTLFMRDWNGNPKYVTREVNPDAAWVLAGEGVATRKYDGTCVMLDDDGRWWARREVKPGKTAPSEFVAVDADTETGKVIGWEPIEQSGYAKWMPEVAFTGWPGPAATYELCGPKVNGNPGGLDEHLLIAHHLIDRYPDVPRDFDGLAVWLAAHPYEGIVWHHRDGRMAKIKARDFPREVGQ